MKKQRIKFEESDYSSWVVTTESNLTYFVMRTTKCLRGTQFVKNENDNIKYFKTRMAAQKVANELNG